MKLITDIDKSDLNTEKSAILKEVYYFLKSKTSDIKRENGENIMVHFEKTSDIYLKISEKPYFEGIIVGLLHDAIEDGYLSFDEIKEKYGLKIAVVVQAISKKKEFYYLNEEEKEIVLESGILNKKFKISNEFRLKNKKGILIKTEKDAFNLMNIAKEKRNKDYFGHIESIEAMSEHIGNIAKENGLILSKTELIKLARIAIEVKYADRIHNLKTQWDPKNIGKVERKTRETIKYFLDSSKEINHLAYLKMDSLVYGLEKNLDKYNKKINDILS